MFLLNLCFLGVVFHCISAGVPYSYRINGGQAIQIEQAPFMAALREGGIHGKYKHLCGAVIISPKYLLTAAQCFYSEEIDWFGITVGTNIKNDESVEVLSIKRIVVHEEYDAFVAPFKHDIALIELDDPLKLSNKVNVIGLNNTLFEAELDAVTYGFGGAYDNNDKLQALTMKTMTNVECRKKVIKTPPVYDFSTLCAYSGNPKQRIGHGDAGGPLIHNRQIVGLISWNPQVVGSEKPEGFTRISTYFDWIKKHAQ